MSIFASLRRTVSNVFAELLGPPIDLTMPPKLVKVSSEAASETVYTATTQGLRIALFQDIPDAPWTWTVEDVTDSKLVAFHSGAATFDAGVLELSEWLIGAGRIPFDVPAGWA